MLAYDELNANGCAPQLISVPVVQPLDTASLMKMFSKVCHVVCVEEHFTNCGLGSMLARLKVEQSASWKLSLLGITPHFIHKIGNCGGLRAACGIAASDIVSLVKSLRV